MTVMGVQNAFNGEIMLNIEAMMQYLKPIPVSILCEAHSTTNRETTVPGHAYLQDLSLSQTSLPNQSHPNSMRDLI